MENKLQTVIAVANLISAFTAPNAADSTEVKIAKAVARYGAAASLAAVSIVTSNGAPSGVS